jgi:hypothetical protein
MTKAVRCPDRPELRIRDNLVRDFHHKVLARFFGRGSAIEGDLRERSPYCDSELHGAEHSSRVVQIVRATFNAFQFCRVPSWLGTGLMRLGHHLMVEPPTEAEPVSIQSEVTSDRRGVASRP